MKYDKRLYKLLQRPSSNHKSGNHTSDQVNAEQHQIMPTGIRLKTVKYESQKSKNTL